MNTKSLMTLSAIILALIGISLIFFPKEILDYFGNNIDYVINDRIGESTKPSRILDLITKKVLRDGG